MIPETVGIRESDWLQQPVFGAKEWRSRYLTLSGRMFFKIDELTRNSVRDGTWRYAI
jgi:hypothetical protein